MAEILTVVLYHYGRKYKVLAHQFEDPSALYISVHIGKSKVLRREKRSRTNQASYRVYFLSHDPHVPIIRTAKWSRYRAQAPEVGSEGS